MVPSRWIRTIAAGVCLTTALSCGAVRAQTVTSSDITARVLPAIVQIAVTINEVEGGTVVEQQLVPRGSGTIVSANGLVLTNAHVLDVNDLEALALEKENQYRAQGIARTVIVDETQFVLLFTEMNQPQFPRFVAERVAVDAPLDLALIQITHNRAGEEIDPNTYPFPLSYVPLGDSKDVARQDSLVVMGYPANATGVISDTGEVNGFELRIGGDERGPWIYTDATISGGSSGGPAVDATGRLVGVTTATDQDCQPGDTNGDGEENEADLGCIPVGSSIAYVRPIAEAYPLLFEADRAFFADLEDDVNAQKGVIGDRYTSPTYDWSVGWDDTLWTVTNEQSGDGVDVLGLATAAREFHPGTIVEFRSMVGFEGNAAACVEAMASVLHRLGDPEAIEDVAGSTGIFQGDGMTDIAFGRNRAGEEIRGGDARQSYAVYTFSLDLGNGTVIGGVYYAECVRIAPDAVLQIAQFAAPRPAYNYWSPDVQRLLAEVEVPEISVNIPGTDRIDAAE